MTTDLDQMEDYADQVYQEDQMTTGTEMYANYQVDANVWEAKLTEIESDLDGKYIFPKKGKTNIRFLLGPNLLPQQFYHPVVTEFDGKAKTRFMAPCIVLLPDNTWSKDIKFVVFGKMVLKDIITILAGGDYDLLHPEYGHGVCINRAGDGRQTKYQVIPSKDPVKIDPDYYEWTQELSEAVDDLENPTPDEDDDVPF